MFSIFNKFYNKPTEGNLQLRNSLSLFAFPFSLLFLGLDSVQFADIYFDGRTIVNFIVITYFFLMLKAADNRLRRLMIMMVPLSYFGEQVVCNLLDMYDYRGNRIPLWVPFAHAIVYGSGYILSQMRWMLAHEAVLKKVFIIFFISIFSIAGLYFGDILTLMLGLLYFHVLRRKKWNNLYFFISLGALWVEYIGTYFGVWAWHPDALGFIPTLNPPAGAIYIYIGGDALLLRIMRFMDKKNILQPTDHNRAKEVW